MKNKKLFFILIFCSILILSLCVYFIVGCIDTIEFCLRTDRNFFEITSRTLIIILILLVVLILTVYCAISITFIDLNEIIKKKKESAEKRRVEKKESEKQRLQKKLDKLNKEE
jgi:predicted membrane protein